jgi:hypothetical protein
MCCLQFRERSESGSDLEKGRIELQNYLTITTPDAMNAIPDQSTPHPLAIGSRHIRARFERLDRKGLAAKVSEDGLSPPQELAAASQHAGLKISCP